MSFSDTQKREHVAELQRHLYDISLEDERIPHVTVDGIYGDETKGAVTAFQNAYGLNVSGEVDLQTKKSISDTHRIVTLLPANLNIFPEDFVLLPQSTGFLVYFVQIMLNILSDEYDNIPKLEIDGIYSPRMHEAVLLFKNISGTDNDIDGIGTGTWNVLAEKVNSKDLSL